MTLILDDDVTTKKSKMKKTMVLLALASAGVSAASNEWTLFEDLQHNGALDTSYQTRYLNAEIRREHFTAGEEGGSDIFKGEFTAPITGSDYQIVNFSAVQDAHLRYYSGSKNEDGNYFGSWFSTSGAKGDFTLELVKPVDEGKYKGPLAVFAPVESVNVNLDGEHGLTVTGTSYIVSNNALSSGKWYWEVQYNNIEGGFGEVGVSSTPYRDKSAWITRHNPFSGGSNYCKKGLGASFEDAAYPKSIVEEGDIISVFLDMDNKTLAYALNGEYLGIACTELPGNPLYPWGRVYNIEMQYNFGQFPWAYPELLNTVE